jgi:hypothetical protein
MVYVNIKVLLALLIGGALTVLLTGCATMRPMTTEDQRVQFSISHGKSKADAFNAVEVGLAEAYRDLPRVLKLRQPETGTFILKPLMSYSMGGLAVQYTSYTLRIGVEDRSCALNFEIGPNEYGVWPAESQVPELKEQCRAIALQIANALGGSLK